MQSLPLESSAAVAEESSSVGANKTAAPESTPAAWREIPFTLTSTT